MDEETYFNLEGLTDEQVARRVANGLVNTNTDVKTKTIGQIFRAHAMTLFNAVNVFLAILVMITGQYRNLTFLFVVFFNLFIGVFQEIRAKRMVDKLSIVTASGARVKRSGEERVIGIEEIVMDDVVLLKHGDQVPADGVVMEGSPLVDESLLTGESDHIEKHRGDELFSGSFVVSGSVAYRVVRVGKAGFAAQINAEAGYVKPINSTIRSTLQMIIEFATIILVPLGLGLFIRTIFMDGGTPQDAILSTVAAVVGMIPQGLVLLTSSVFAIATTVLGRRMVLVQQSYCVETLARVDTLCLDKTGTITSGAMEVVNVRPVGDAAEEDVVAACATICAATAEDANETSRALIAYVDKTGGKAYPFATVVPFSSARKYSGCVTTEGRALVMGAAQFVLRDQTAQYRDIIDSFDELERVISVAEADGFTDDGQIVGEVRPLGFVGIRDEIRPTAAETINFFRDQGVTLKVISGDDPRTVSAIAAAVGVENARAYVDATTLKTEEDLINASREMSVFGRVTPQQKRSLVRALHADGHIVAMTGDGVNDVLALKEADCSISMASGSAAARNVSEIVLADNDFAHMPEVVAEGRRSINNLQRSASLFLVKTVFSALLTGVCIFLPPYPFIPIQMTLISFAVIGWPSFALSLEPNHELVTGDFLTNVLRRSVPASVAIVVALLAVQVAERIMGFTFDQASTLSLYLTALVGVALIVRISQPLTLLRGLLLVSVLCILAVGCFIYPSFFKLAPMTVSMGIFLAISAAGALALFLMLYERTNSPHIKHYRMERSVTWLKTTFEAQRAAGRAWLERRRNARNTEAI